ncbi:MAG: hypothetical protein WCF23_10635 [Candidatus Nitrosopolaris sp.]
MLYSKTYRDGLSGKKNNRDAERSTVIFFDYNKIPQDILVGASNIID